jgi:polysaccharide pyruvyl transferase CsaB
MLHLGYFGFGNFGDELLREAVEQKYKGLPQRFIVGQVKADNQIGRKEFTKILTSMESCEWFSLGPGGILQDRTSRLSLIYYLVYCLVARLMGMKIQWFAQGVSPLKSPFSMRLVGWISRFVSKCGVRDVQSRDVLLECGVCSEKIEVSPDLVFGLKFPITNVKENVCGVIIRDWALDMALLIKLIDSGISQRKYWFLFQKDVQLEETINKLVPEAEVFVYGETGAFLDRLSSTSSIISMRYHGVVLGLNWNKPVCVLSYDQKCLNLCKEYDLKHVCDVSNGFDSEVLMEKIKEFDEELKHFS